MTASPARRRRVTLAAWALSVLALGAAALLGVAGMRTLANSTAGQPADVAANPTPTARLPSTATAMVGVVDDTGRLTSSVVMALEPDGTGGTIVVFAASADAGAGTTGQLEPLDAALGAFGPLRYGETMERLSGLSFDVLEIVDADRLADLITPLGDLTVNLPVGARDASTTEQWDVGEVVASAPEAARLMTALDPGIDDWYYESTRAAVWNAIADRVGAGIGSAEPVGSDRDLPPVLTLDEFVDRLFAGPVASRSLGFQVLGDGRIAEQRAPGLEVAFAGDALDVVVHDRAEMLLVLGAVAPARLGAPLEAPTVRLVSSFSDDELAEAGIAEAELLKRALDRLLSAQVNVVSVAIVPEETIPRSDAGAGCGSRGARWREQRVQRPARRERRGPRGGWRSTGSISSSSSAEPRSHRCRPTSRSTAVVSVGFAWQAGGVMPR